MAWLTAFFGGGKLTLYAILGTVVAVCVAVTARNCRIWATPPKPPRPPHVAIYDVVSVDSGASLTVDIGLIPGRRQGQVWLSGITIPASVADASRANLEKIVGKAVRTETPRIGLFRGTADDAAPIPDEILEGEDCEALEASGSVTGVVFGESGACCQIEQLRAGMAEIVGVVPDEWRDAQKQAKRARLGYWGK